MWSASIFSGAVWVFNSFKNVPRVFRLNRTSKSCISLFKTCWWKFKKKSNQNNTQLLVLYSSANLYIVQLKKTNIKGNFPVFTSLHKNFFNISQDTLRGTLLAVISADDKDSGRNGEVRFGISTESGLNAALKSVKSMDR